MSQLVTLWGEKIKSTLNDFKARRGKKFSGSFFSASVGCSSSSSTTSSFSNPQSSPEPEPLVGLDIALVGSILVDQLITMINLTLFSVLIFSNIVASLSALYLSRDLDLLLSSPIPHTRLFIAKFAQSTVNSSYMVVIFGLPIYFALGRAFGVGAGTTSGLSFS